MSWSSERSASTDRRDVQIGVTPERHGGRSLQIQQVTQSTQTGKRRMYHAAPLPSLVTPPNVLRKVTWRLLPFLCLLYVFNILDRANVGFAKLTMQDDVGISPAVFDLGVGIFYFG